MNKYPAENMPTLRGESEQTILLKEIVKEAVREELAKLSLSGEQKYIKGIDNLAKFLGISKSVVQKMKNEGVIPYIQYDRVVLFSPDEVWCALKKVTPVYNQ